MKTPSIGWLAAFLRPKLIHVSEASKSTTIIFVLALLLPVSLRAQLSLSGSTSSQVLPFGGSTYTSTIRFDQAQNGGVSRPAISPVNWVAGNGSGSNSHFSEGQSIPYRATLTNVSPGTHTVIIEWDLRRDKKTAIDYITSFQRIGETVDPLRGLSGDFGQPAYFAIPAPQRNKSVTGTDGTRAQPAYSFNKLPAAERQVTIYNAVPTGIAYFYEGDPGDWYAPSKMKFTFKVTGTSAKTVVLAWGGHIASRADWGAQNAYTDMYSSPYRSKLISLDQKLSLIQRSLQYSALKPSFVPAGEVKGNPTFCTEVVYQYSAVTNIASPTFHWTVNGGTIQNGQGTGLISVKWNDVSQASVAVALKDQNNSTIGVNASKTLTRDVVCPYYTPSDAGKVETLIGSELTSLHTNFQPGNPPASNFIYTVSNDKVLIEVIASAGEYSNLLALLKSPAYGLTGEVDNDNTRIITGFFPIANLLMLNDLPAAIKYVRPAYPPVTNVGVTTTKGDVAQRSDLVRLGYDVSGKNIKVGVLSDSYNKQPGNPALANVLNNDLPANVRVLKDSPFGGIDEGRAMLQIIHDIAPEAKLAFRTGIVSSGDFAKGIKELQQDSCDIIVDDLTYLTEPFFQDGQVASTVDLVTSQGVSYFTSAGNFGNKSYTGTFSPGTAPAGVAGTAHDFSGGDIFQKVTLGPGTYTIVLQWEDPIYSLGQVQTGTLNDLDLYLTTDAGATLFGFNRNNLGADPIEVLPFTVRAESTTNIMIVRAAGNDNVKLKYIVFRGDKFVFNEHNPGSSTIVGQANSRGAITVGAVLYSNTEAYGYKRPADAGQFTVASFSSIGGNPVAQQDRLKPDIIAPNGANTTVTLGGLDTDYDLGGSSDGFYNFFGTSAAAPHAAGVAALLMEARKKYYNGERYTPEGIRQVLKSSAVNMHESGYDVKSGAGFIQADAALRTFAAPQPQLVEMAYDTATIEPGKSEFVLTVNGKNLTPESKVFMRAAPLPTTYVGPTQLQAVVSPFTGNPAIHVYTAAFSPSGRDGGGSDTLYFKDRRLIDVQVIADDKTKKYGEVLPAFTATVLVDGDTVTSTTEPSLADLGLTQLQFATPANSMSNADQYLITVAAELSEPLKEVYKYTFLDGLLTIEKLPLVIRPNDIQAIYGEKFDDKITFSYQFNGTRIESPQTILTNLRLDHQAILAPNVIALVDSRAIVNASRPLVNADLQNLSFLASSRAIANSRAIVNRSRAIVNSTQVVDFDKQSMLEYFENPDTANLITPIFNSRAIVNRSRALVNSRAIVNSRALVNYSRALVNRSRALVNSRAIVNSGALVNSETVGEDGTNSNRDAVIIIDSLDIFNNDAPIIVDGEEVYELPALYSINVVTGLTAGSHFIVPGTYLTDLSNNFDVSYATGNLKILKDTLTVTASGAQIQYGVSQPTYNATVTGYQYDDNFASVVSSITFTLKDQNGSIRAATGVAPAGNYKVLPAVTLKPTALQPGEPVNYITKVIQGTLAVSRVPLIVKATNIVINAGQIPPYASTYVGLVNGDVPVSGPSYTTSPSYTGSPGVYTITPKSVMFAVPGNYDIQYQTGTLYVNPKLDLCKAVRPILRCVEEISNNPAYKYKARFEYENDNATAVFIPIGPDNSLVSAKGFSGTQPELLQPGGGSFDVLFNGDKLTWTLTTYDKGKKTSIASSASSSSSRCRKGGSGREDVASYTAYPSPFDRFTAVRIPEGVNPPSASNVQIVDQWGRKYPVSMDWSPSNQTLTFDFWYYPKGYYLITIQTSGGMKMMRVYKN